jgi:predicted hydrocarbon binding protein
MLQPSGFYYPNTFARAILLAVHDVMGRYGFSALEQQAQTELPIPPDTLDRAYDYALLSAMGVGLEAMYGKKGAIGIAKRVGMVAFVLGFKGFGALKGLGSRHARALPTQTQVRLGLTALAGVFSHFSDQTSAVQEEDEAFFFITARSPFAYGRSSDRPTCAVLSGMLEECLRWATNGYAFHIRETHCCAVGDETCVFRIHKTALGEAR